jgi:hypothetical protein
MRLGRWIAAGAVVLTACSGGTKTGPAELPAGQHDLGHNVAVVVHDVKDVPGAGTVEPHTHVVAVDVEYLNRGDAAVEMRPAYAAELHTVGNVNAEGINLPTDAGLHEFQPGVIPAHAGLRGWMGYQVPDGDKPAAMVLYGGDIGDDAKPVTVNL